MRITLKELARLVGGSLVGDEAFVIEGAAPVESAAEKDIAFVRKDTLRKLGACSAGALLTPERVEGVRNQIVVEDPQRAFIEVLKRIEAERRARPEGVHTSAWIDPEARLEDGVAIGPGAVVGARASVGRGTVIHPNATIGPDCRIGEDCEVYSGAVIYHGVVLGDRVIVHGNATIGGDGFGFLDTAKGNLKVPQVGGVRIGSDVEIGCNTTIDRGALGDTVVEDNVKIDNHCHIAHNCRIGANSVLVGYARLGGSTTVGKHCILAEDSAVTDHVALGDNCVVTATARVSKSWPSGSILGGAPAMPFDKAKRVMMAQRRLPRLIRQLAEIREKLGMD